MVVKGLIGDEAFITPRGDAPLLLVPRRSFWKRQIHSFCEMLVIYKFDRLSMKSFLYRV